MSRAITMRADGREILVETDEAVVVPRITVTPGGSTRRLPDGAEEVVSIEEFQNSLDSVNDTIVSCCRVLQKSMDAISPHKFAVEFSIKLSGEAGIPMLTKSSAEANFMVTVEWQKP